VIVSEVVKIPLNISNQRQVVFLYRNNTIVCVSHWCAEHANIIRAQSGVKPILWWWREKKKWIQHINTCSTHTHARALVQYLWSAVCAPWVLIKRCTGSLENTHTHTHAPGGSPLNLYPVHGCSGPCELPTLSLHHACINIYHTSNNFLCPLHVHKSPMCGYSPFRICPTYDNLNEATTSHLILNAMHI